MGWLAPPGFLVALALALAWVLGDVGLIVRVVRRHARAVRESPGADVRWTKRAIAAIVLLVLMLLVGCVVILVVLLLSPPWETLAKFLRGDDWRK